MLQYPSGDAFATIEMDYDNNPIREGDDSNRIIIRVNVQDIPSFAVVDTGGVYLFIPPYISNKLILDPQDIVEEKPKPLRFGKYEVQGKLYSIPLTFGDSGSSKLVTAFIADSTQNYDWGDFPVFLGYQGCLDKFRFAVDPISDKFYVGDVT
jgi:hypothetical protein